MMLKACKMKNKMMKKKVKRNSSKAMMLSKRIRKELKLNSKKAMKSYMRANSLRKKMKRFVSLKWNSKVMKMRMKKCKMKRVLMRNSHKTNNLNSKKVLKLYRLALNRMMKGFASLLKATKLCLKVQRGKKLAVEKALNKWRNCKMKSLRAMKL